MGYLCVERTINVPLEKLWPTAGDFTKSPDPSLLIKIVKKGDETRLGVGCERQIYSGKTIFHERLNSIDPPNSFSYEMLSGSPTKYQRGKVWFKAVGESTHIKWETEFAPKIPCTGWIIKLVTKRFYNKFIDEFAKIR